MTFMQFLADLTSAMVPVLATALLGLIGVGTTYLGALVRAKFGEQKAAKTDVYLAMINKAATGAVVSVQQSVVDTLKASGTWNAETAARCKNDAVALALASLGTLQSEIQQQLKIDVPATVANEVEMVLKNLKDATAK